MARASKKKHEAPAPAQAPTVVPIAPLPPKIGIVEPEPRYTHAELRTIIDEALGKVAYTDSVGVGYCTAVYQEIKRSHDVVAEAYVRGKNLVVEARSGRNIERVVLEGVA